MAEALQRETQTIPVVFVAVTDPLSSGLVASMARPGGNLTGFANYVASKACRSDCKRPDPPGLRRRGPWATTQRLLGAPPHSFGFRACGGGRIYVPQFVPCQRGYDALLLAADDVRVLAALRAGDEDAVLDRIRAVECDHTLRHSLTFFRSCLRSVVGRKLRKIGAHDHEGKPTLGVVHCDALWIGTPRINLSAIGFHILGRDEYPGSHKLIFEGFLLSHN